MTIDYMLTLPMLRCLVTVGSLVKVTMQWGQPPITGIIIKKWYDRSQWVYDVRNVKSGLKTHAIESNMELISESR